LRVIQDRLLTPLPQLLLLTDRVAAAGRHRSLPETAAAAVAAVGGDLAILLREKDLPRQERRMLARELRSIVEPAGAQLIIASDAQLARDVGAAVHLAAAEPYPGRPPLITGRSCHTAGDVRRAAAEGCDYVTVSPVFATASKPGYGPALGLGGLASLCRARPRAEAGTDAAETVPLVYALGGVTPGTAGDCLRAGAHGVAVMGAVMGSPDPRITAADLLRELA